MPKNPQIHKVLVIGSGPIVIGQAAEFDYAGTQACRALREEGLEVVLVNSNPATIMTDTAMADEIYMEPLKLETLERIILEAQPDSLLPTLGGQTGLTLAMQLAKSGFLKEHNVRLLGANPETIDKAEDRQMFKDTMLSINQPCVPSKVVTTTKDALDYAKEIGYPVIVRPAFTLGGAGGGVVEDGVGGEKACVLVDGEKDEADEEQDDDRLDHRLSRPPGTRPRAGRTVPARAHAYSPSFLMTSVSMFSTADLASEPSLSEIASVAPATFLPTPRLK